MENIDSVLTSEPKKSVNGKEYIKKVSTGALNIIAAGSNQHQSKGNSLRVKYERISWEKDC